MIFSSDASSVSWPLSRGLRHDDIRPVYGTGILKHLYSYSFVAGTAVQRARNREGD